MDDDAVESSMPAQWWLTVTSAVWNPTNLIRCFLAIQVHRKNKEIAAQCNSQSAGQTRNQQRDADADQTASVRSDARSAKMAAERTAERDADPYYHQEKKLRIMVVRTNILKEQNDMISTQCTLLANNEALFVRVHGQAAYDKKLCELLAKLPDPVQALLADVEVPMEPSLAVPQDSTSDDDDEEA